VSRLQQTIKHNESSHEETIIEIDRLQQQAEHLNNEYAQDTLQLEEIKQTLQEAEEQQQVVDEQLAESFLIKDDLLETRAVWQVQWETYLTQSSQCKEQVEVQRVKLSHLNNQSQQLQQRLYQRLPSDYLGLTFIGVGIGSEPILSSISLAFLTMEARVSTVFSEMIIPCPLIC